VQRTLVLSLNCFIKMFGIAKIESADQRHKPATTKKNYRDDCLAFTVEIGNEAIRK